jgi:hypothetical protein
MLNLYVVTVWHSSAPHDIETIEVRTYSAARAEQLASESFPGCSAVAEPLDIETLHRGQVPLPSMPMVREIPASNVVRDG